MVPFLLLSTSFGHIWEHNKNTCAIDLHRCSITCLISGEASVYAICPIPKNITYQILGTMVCILLSLGARSSTTKGVSAMGATSAIPIQVTQYQ